MCDRSSGCGSSEGCTAGVGPTRNFGMYSDFSKFVLMFDMLAGRLELYPLLILFMPSLWRRK